MSNLYYSLKSVYCSSAYEMCWNKCVTDFHAPLIMKRSIEFCFQTQFIYFKPDLQLYNLFMLTFFVIILRKLTLYLYNLDWINLNTSLLLCNLKHNVSQSNKNSFLLIEIVIINKYYLILNRNYAVNEFYDVM